MGEIEPSKLSFFLSDNSRGESAAALVLTDEYEMDSLTVYGSRFVKGDSEHAQINLENLQVGAAESLCDRVSKCVGYTATFSANTNYSREIREFRHCPAINKTVLIT